MSQKENMLRFLNSYTLNELRAELDRQKYVVIRENDMPKIVNSLKPEFFNGLTEDGLKSGLKRIGIKDFGDLSKGQLVDAILSNKEIEEAILDTMNSSGAGGVTGIIGMFFMKIDSTAAQDVFDKTQEFYKEIAAELKGSLVKDDEVIKGVDVKGYVIGVNNWDNRITIYEGYEEGEYQGWIMAIMEEADVKDFLTML